MKKTLEEDLLDTVIQIVGDSDCTTIKEFFVKHNWQQEQDKNKYSEEEVIAFVKWMYDYKADINKVEELFEQFKNK